MTVLPAGQKRGRYCLNDAHKAAGDIGHQRQSKWLPSDQSNDLVDELVARNRALTPVYIRKGRGITGTYAVKELVYAYAMWISPAYHLKVIRAYDRMVADGVAVHVMRDNRNMLEDLGGEDVSSFADIYLDAYKREKPCFALPQREEDILLTGYSTTMRAAAINCWRELEAKIAKSINQLLDGAASMTSQEIAGMANIRHDKVKQSIERLADRGVIQLPPMGDVKNSGDPTVRQYVFQGEQGKRDLTMTSQEIADLMGSRHDNVKTSVEQLIDRGVIEAPAMQELRSDSGQMTKAYLFSGEQGKRDSIIVVAQLCPEFTASLVDRWQELETQVAKPQFKVPTTLHGALPLAAEQEEQRAVLMHQVEVKDQKMAEDAPKLDAYKQLVNSAGVFNYQKFCTKSK